jgi:cell wall-associated NlpC family hydrolase
MVSRQQIVTAARAKLGAAFRHQGRGPEAYDCVGLVIKVAHELGLSNFDSKGYTRAPNPAEMREALEANLEYVRFDTVQPGDVLWFRAPEPQHLGIVTSMLPMQMVHAFQRTGRVVETGIDRFWRQRIVACFRYRGLDG